MNQQRKVLLKADPHGDAAGIVEASIEPVEQTLVGAEVDRREMFPAGFDRLGELSRQLVISGENRYLGERVRGEQKRDDREPDHRPNISRAEAKKPRAS